MKYAVVMPAKDEQHVIRAAIESIMRQTIPAQCVLIMNDGSTDKTLQIIRELELEYPKLCHHDYESAESQNYSLGGKVVRLFNLGKEILDGKNVEYEWIVKLDADIKFENDFMERIAANVAKERFGIVSGTPYYLEGGRKIYEFSPPWHTHGQFKIYNRKCYEDMNGIPESLGWDTADNIMALDSGWKVQAFTDITYQMHRKVGGKSSMTKGRINHGIGCYVLGYSYSYFLLKVLHDIFRAPVLFGACYLVHGYLLAASNRFEKILIPRQRMQLRRLLWLSLSIRAKDRKFNIQQQIFRKEAG